MQKLEKIAEHIRQTFDAQTAVRDKALGQARALTRACALSIRAVHRDETDVMQSHLDEARGLADSLRIRPGRLPGFLLCRIHPGFIERICRGQHHLRPHPPQAPANAGGTDPASQYLSQRAGRVGGRDAPPLPGHAATGQLG